MFTTRPLKVSKIAIALLAVGLQTFVICAQKVASDRRRGGDNWQGRSCCLFRELKSPGKGGMERNEH